MRFLFLMIPVVRALFTIRGPDILFHDERVHIRGINWYGFETDLRVIEGLWVHPMDWYLDVLEQYQFNALRVPVSEQLILYEPTAIPAPENIKTDPELANLKSIEILDRLFDKCRSRGIAILLDVHVLKIRRMHPLWYLQGDPKYTEGTLFRTWEILLDRFGNYSNLMGIELINEPHDSATFGTGNLTTDVDGVMVRFLQNFTGTPLIFMDGVFWGKDFRNVSLDILDPSRVVFSPHFYGPTLAPLPDYSMEYIRWYYDKFIGFLIGKRPIVITEWGFNPGTDITWVKNFITYLKSNNITNSFFWSLNPDGKDIKGLLKNWTFVEPFRYAAILELCPEPTVFSFKER